MADNILIGERIKQVREERGITQEELAKCLGLNKSTIQRYETAKIDKIKLPVIDAMAGKLNVNPEWLTGKTDLRTDYSTAWDKAAAEFEKESQNDAKMLMNYLSKLFDDTESVRIAYELIISLARLNRNGLLELSKMLDIFSRTDEYKSDISKEEEKLNEI